MRILGKYVKEHIKHLIIYAGTVGIFALLLYLHDMDISIIRYAVLLTSLWAALFLGIGLARYAKKHRTLSDLEKAIQVEWKPLPDPSGLIEEDYQTLLRSLYDRKQELESESDAARKDMLEYYSMWAHQIKTPIAAMGLLLQTDEGTGEKPPAQIKSLKNELFKIEQYVEMVMSYLRMDAMSSDLRLQWYSLDDMVKQAVRKYSQLFIAQKIKISVDVGTRMVLTDEKWLVFVLEQIISNALKYTRQGGILVYVQGKTLVIEDTGIGIQKEDLPRVFEKGFTGYNGREDKKSTGIGLYLCKSILDKLNHGIRIESDISEGTRVYLLLDRE